MKFNLIIFYGICLIASQLSAQIIEQTTQIIPDSLSEDSSVADTAISPVKNYSQDSISLSEVDSSSDTAIKFVDVDSDYVIAVFVNDERSFPQGPDKYIDVLKDSTSLTQLDYFPDTLASGMLILRRRFGPEEYSLYLGVISEYAKTKQSDFFIYNFSDSLSLKNAVTLKFYDDKVENPNADIENVYFDDNHMYIPKLSKVYYHTDSSWKMITASNAIVIKKKTTGDISITSNPVGATVSINDEASGSVTPYLLTGLKPGNYSVSVVLKDYKGESKNIDVKEDTVTQVNFDLKSTVGLEHKFFVSVNFNPEYYFNLFTENTDNNWQTGMRKDPTIVSVRIPSNEIGYGGALQMEYRLKNRFWLSGGISLSKYKLDDYMWERDTGIIDREYQKWVSSRTTSITGIAIGAGYDVFRTPFYRLSVSIHPQYAYLKRNIDTFDSLDIESPIYQDDQNKNIMLYIISRTVMRSHTSLSGSAFGSEISVDNKFFVRRNLCINLQLGFNSVIAKTLSGKRKISVHKYISDPTGQFGDLVTDTTWTDKIEALKGNIYNTGEVIIYSRPEDQSNLKKAAIELTKIFCRIGICFYF